jgi:tRNA-splicing ligase RtcB
MDLGYFVPGSRHYEEYRNAVAAGGNYAIANRLIIGRVVGEAFARVFGSEPELLYEISHNLVQEESHPDLFGRPVFVHRKGATRALPAGHPLLAGTPWARTGHPVLIPGSMGDTSYVLRPLPGASRSLYSVNHGCGRRKSRSAARREISQQAADRRMRDLGVLVNAGGRVPIDESPDCYKPAEEVIRAVTEGGLASVETRLRPIASIKGND